VNNVIARRQNEGRRRCLLFFDQPIDSPGVGFGRVNPPDKPARDRRRIAAVARRQSKRHMPGRHHRHSLREWG
jgi:hypothetical protein